MNSGGRRGDMYVKIEIETPIKLSSEERELLQKLDYKRQPLMRVGKLARSFLAAAPPAFFQRQVLARLSARRKKLSALTKILKLPLKRIRAPLNRKNFPAFAAPASTDYRLVFRALTKATSKTSAEFTVVTRRCRLSVPPVKRALKTLIST